MKSIYDNVKTILHQKDFPYRNGGFLYIIEYQTNYQKTTQKTISKLETTFQKTEK